MNAKFEAICKAYEDGRASFHAGDAEPPKGVTDVEKEFRRGYMMTRKHTRFADTIRARNKVSIDEKLEILRAALA